MKRISFKLKPGLVVPVFNELGTKAFFEGCARLVRLVDVKTDLWNVQFIDDDAVIRHERVSLISTVYPRHIHPVINITY